MFEEEERNVYSDEAREELTDSDEINEAEDGFMKGYEEETNTSECANCHSVLTDDVIEEEFDGELCRFCSEECATKFEEKKQHEH